jgi:hypothetical protein
LSIPLWLLFLVFLCQPFSSLFFLSLTISLLLYLSFSTILSLSIPHWLLFLVNLFLSISLCPFYLCFLCSSLFIYSIFVNFSIIILHIFVKLVYFILSLPMSLSLFYLCETCLLYFIFVKLVYLILTFVSFSLLYC